MGPGTRNGRWPERVTSVAAMPAPGTSARAAHGARKDERLVEVAVEVRIGVGVDVQLFVLVAGERLGQELLEQAEQVVTEALGRGRSDARRADVGIQQRRDRVTDALVRLR